MLFEMGNGGMFRHEPRAAKEGAVRVLTGMSSLHALWLGE